VLAAVVHRLTRPRGLEDLERLVEHPCAPPVVELLAGDRELAAEHVTAEADTERQAATAEAVERRALPGDLHRPASGQRRHHRAEPDALGGGGHGRQRDPWVRHRCDGLAPAHVIPDEEPVPAELLRLGSQTGDQRGIGELVEERQEQPGAHARQP
jgi:hypothetical protein